MRSTATSQLARITHAGRDIDLEYQAIAPDRHQADLLVYLHEGLGSVDMWRQFPSQLCDAAACRGLVYSRYGYGGSTPKLPDEKWPVSYMHDHARTQLPALLEVLNLHHERVVLYGHSDGASIALLYAAMYPERVKGVVVAAPHIFVEDITITSIEAARQAYLHTDLPQRLGRFHAHPDSAFWGWNDVWLNPEFRAWNITEYLSDIQCPVLAIQGEDDEYGTLEQIYGIQRILPDTQLCILPDCRHSPHKDQTLSVIERVQGFMQQLE